VSLANRKGRGGAKEGEGAMASPFAAWPPFAPHLGFTENRK